jgi:subtilisin family serine protease
MRFDSKVVFLLCVLIGPLSLCLTAQQSDHKTIHVKFKEKDNQVVQAFVSGAAMNSNKDARKSAFSGVLDVDKVSEKHNAYSLKRIFPDAGRFEEAHRAYGLHLWYEIELEDDARMKAVVDDYRATGSFDNVEESRPYSYVRDVSEPSEFNPLPTLLAGSNDPEFSKQWHFKNQGQTGGTVSADINLVKAWQKETGSPNIIVAVIDGGIDIRHPDLQSAIWVNSREIPGNGKDDDQNGYIDDVNGYGFGDKTSSIPPDDHATHVAGTIGALTNNGIGVSGIAGGNGSQNGVRLMSCASFGSFGVGGFEQAMVYAADNGAVISQNSWGGGSRAIEAAIDYFINRAGYDNSAAKFSKNIQTGPMAGGIVIFAAGNKNTWDAYYGYPGSYDKVIAVGATDHKDVKSQFSNYGTWVDIFAPGTDVFSTTIAGYQNFSGTSMACPHVSGVAALVISNLQRPGLKPNEVWNRLRLSARSINSMNPNLVGQLGWGRLDASVALKDPDIIPPGAITDLRADQIRGTSLLLSWMASGENNSEGQAAEYEIRFSINPIDNSNFSAATLVPNAPTPPVSGEQVSLLVKNLSPATTYYFAIKSTDVFNNVSPLSNILKVITLKPPIPELITTQLSEQLFTGGTSERKIIVKNIGDEELLVRAGIPQLQLESVLPPLGAKGRLFAINSSSNTIEELNTQTGEVIRSVPMPEPSTKTIEGLAFDGTYLYYGRSQKIYKIHSATGAIVNTIFLKNATAIRGLAWSGRYLYVSRYNYGYSSYATDEVDVDDGRIVRTLNFYSELAFFGNNHTLLLGSTGQIDEVDISSGSIVRSIPTSNPGSIAFSSYDNLLFVQNGNTASIDAIKPTDGSVVYSFPYPTTTTLAGDENKLGWFKSAEDVISIGSGKTGEIPVSFTSAGINANTLTGSVNVISMNSNTNALSVPLTLKVLSGTDIETAKEINFGTQYVGFMIDTTIIIENRGFAPLVISQIQSNNNRVSSSISSATLAPGQRISMRVSVQPNLSGSIAASITLTSNDPDEGVLSVPVSALIIEAPVINSTPDSLLVLLKEGASTTRTVSITNTGGSTFFWTAGLSGTDPTGNSQSTARQFEDTQQLSSIEKTSFEEIVLKSDSPETLSGLVYDPIGELIYAKSLTDNNFYTYNPVLDKWSQIGLAPSGFYGQATCLNGKLYFGGTRLNVYSIQSKSWSAIPFPIAGDAQSLTNDDKFVYIAINKTLYRLDPNIGNWLELSPVPGPLYMSGFGALSYHSGVIYATGTQEITGDGNTLFFKYFPETNTWFTPNSIAGRLSLGGAIDASTARYFVVGAPERLSNNAIQMSILNIRSGEWTRLATPFVVGHGLTFVGKDGASGIYFIEGGAGRKLGFYKTPSASNWFTVTPSSGSIKKGETQLVNVGVNAQSLFGGVYRGNIRINSMRPSIQKNVPLELRVAGTADISIGKSSTDVGNVIMGYDRGIYLTIGNKGSAELVVSSISTNNSDFYVSKSSFRLPVGESTTLVVYFKPKSVGKQVGVFTFFSNDPFHSEVNFSLIGVGVYPPMLKVPADTIKVTLLSGQAVKKKFVIENIGQGATQYLTVWGVESWIKIDSAGWAVNINANSLREFEANISATGFSQGRYTGSIHVEDYFDPTGPSYSIPIVIDVTNAPDFTSSIDSLNYGDEFITGNYDSTFQVKNTGVLPLSIFSWSLDNTVFKVQGTAPVTLQPGASLDMAIRFSPTSLGPQKGKLTFTTNDPDESLVVLNIKGAGINPPKVVSTKSELFFTAYPKESKSDEISLSNQGGSILKWRVDKELNPQPTGGVFTRKADVPLPFQYSGVSLIAVTADPTSGELYAQYPWYQDLYAYVPSTDSWVDIGQAPARSQRALAGAVIVDRKMYCSYSDDRSKIYIYDITLQDWSTRPNSLNFASATITTDGKLLYMAGEGKFASYNPRTGEWKNLQIPSLPLDGLGGLSHLDGVIYAHSSSNSRFSKYTINTGVWETLVPLPGKTSLGSTVDVARKRYYAYGEEYLYEYDIANNVWTTLLVPLFKMGGNGGMAYISTPGYEGVYFRQANSEKGFGRYEPENGLPWLRTSQLIGTIESMDDKTIGVNCNTANLSPGLYRGKIKVTSNDPNNAAFDMPVTLTVKNPAPKINITSLISDIVDRLVPTTKYVVIRNDGKDRLDWSFAATLPSWISANRSSGGIEGQAVDSLAITFTPAKFIVGGQADYTIETNSNDPQSPKSKTRVLFALRNLAPIRTKPMANQSLSSGQIEISLLDYFSDPDNDPLTFSASASANSIVTTSVVGSKLIVNPLKTGVVTIAVTASDFYNYSVKSEFEVNTIVTGIAGGASELIFSASPNPVFDKFKIYIEGYDLEKATITLFDITGRVVLESAQNNGTSLNEHEVDASKLSAGLYLCMLSIENKFVGSIKLLKK